MAHDRMEPEFFDLLVDTEPDQLVLDLTVDQPLHTALVGSYLIG